MLLSGYQAGWPGGLEPRVKAASILVLVEPKGRNMMQLSTVMKGLLDTEWRHNRGYMLVTFILIIYAPLIKTLLVMLQGDNTLLQWGQELDYALHFGIGLRRPDHYSGLLEWLPFVGSVLLGIIILGGEQQSSLKYLVSTPVSRRQIILSKFFTGAATIVLAMLFNVIFLTGLDRLYAMPFNSLEVFNWVLLAGAVCLGYYTLGLMVSTFTGGVLAAGIMVFLLNMLPGILTAMIENIAVRFFAAGQSVSIQIYTIGSYLSLHDYITRSGRNITHVVHYPNYLITGTAQNASIMPNYQLECGLLILGVCVLLTLSVMIFERVSLSAGGSMFLSSRAGKAGLVLGALYIAYILVFSRAESLLGFSIDMVIVTGLICIGVEFLYRLQRGGWHVFKR